MKELSEETANELLETLENSNNIIDRIDENLNVVSDVIKSGVDSYYLDQLSNCCKKISKIEPKLNSKFWIVKKYYKWVFERLLNKISSIEEAYDEALKILEETN